MRRQRIARVSSAQSLCIFCACRFGLEPGIAQVPRSSLTTTRSFAQNTSTSPVISNGPASSITASASASASASAFTFDPHSSLTANEQQEKWRRLSAQRKVIEERQRIEAEQQQAKQKAIWEAGGKQRKVAAEKAEGDRRADMARAEAERRKRLRVGSGEHSSSLNPAPAVSAPTRQSLGQAMLSSGPLQGARSLTKHPRHDRERKMKDRPQNESGRREYPTGLTIRKHAVLSQEELLLLRKQQRQGSRSTIQRSGLQSSPNARGHQQKQPQRVAMPDFMLPAQGSVPAAAPTTGWGARPTDVKPLEYGDVRSSVEESTDINPNIQDVPDLPHSQSAVTHHASNVLDYKERPCEQDQPVLAVSDKFEKPPLPKLDHDTTEGVQESAQSQNEGQSHTSTLDSFGYFEDESPDANPSEASFATGQAQIHLPSIKREGITEAAMKAATLGGFERSDTGGLPRSSTEQTGHSTASSSPSSRAPSSDLKITSESPAVETSAISAEPIFDASSSSSSNAATHADQMAGSPGGEGMPTPASGLSPQREMIEKMRRMVDDFDRMYNPKATTTSPATHLLETEQSAPLRSQSSSPSQPRGRSASPPASVLAKAGEPAQQSQSGKPGNAAFQDLKASVPQTHLGDTGYRATPFNPDEVLQSSQEPVKDEGKWGLLRRQQDTKAAPPPPPPISQPSDRSQWQASRFKEEDADKLFEKHRASRASYAPSASAHHESYSFGRTYSDQDISNKKCGRCGQVGHTAGMCQGPVRQQRRERSKFDLYVGGVSTDATDADFQAYFMKFEDVLGARLIKSHSNALGQAPRSRGFGFISFETEQARDRFMSKGPFTLLGKQMRIQLDQGSAQDGSGQSHPATVIRHSSRAHVSNPFDPTELADDGHVIRRASSESRFNSVDSSNAASPPTAWQTGINDPSGEMPRGLKEAEPSAVPTDEPRRNDREARRRQWEESEVDASKSARGAERKGRRGSRREIEEDEEDERGGAREAHRARKAARQRQKDAEKDAEKQAAKRKREMKKKEAGTPITLPEFISVQHLSQALGVRYEAFVQRLEDLGYDDIFAGKTLDSETSGMIAMEYNFDPTFDGGYREEEVRDLKARPPLVDRDSLPTRPPVVTIMGHVDHGKTTILDYLRKSSVAAGEAGGITQHIGAFSVPLAASGKTVTFLDTPGHAAFLAMRQRGAHVTDMVILVVAADDSVKPQTLEAIKHAKEAGVPMIVALNKVDKPEADVERCKQDLARHGVEIEDYGGEVQVVEVSGKTGKGMDALEENVVALSELLDHRAETDGAVEGWVLEATTRKAGRVATVLVRRGTLVPGAIIVAGKTWARVRSLRNEAGIELKEGGPGMPCEVDGWRDQPSAGDEVLEAPTEQKAGSVVEFRIELAEREQAKRDMEIINTNRKLEQEKREKEKAAEQAAKRAAAATTASVGSAGAPIPAFTPDATAAPSEEQIEKESGPVTIPFIIKADVSGSAEAVAAYILSLSSPLIAPTVLASGVGPVHESDIELASAAEGHIIAFNLPNNPEAMGNATARGVKILANDIIYRCLDDVKAVLEDKLPPIVTSRVTGEAEISARFEIGAGGRKKIAIAGVKVRNGSITRNARARVLRSGQKIYDGTVNSLKNQKKDVDVMRKGSECGMGFADWESFDVGDQVQVYEEITEKRRL